MSQADRRYRAGNRWPTRKTARAASRKQNSHNP